MMEMNNNCLIPLDMIGTDNSTCFDISFQQKLCVYSIGSLIVLYNMENDNKKFITYYQAPIALVKFLSNAHLFTIDCCSSPMLIIWSLSSLNIMMELPIKTYPNFKVGAIYIDKVNQDKYLLLITSIDCNLLYEINLIEHNDIAFDFISPLKTETFAIGFQCFNSSNDFAIILPDVLEYHRITKDPNNNGHSIAMFQFRINFPFRLQYDTLRISSVINIVAVLNEQGSCLLFDQNGNAKPSLAPFKQEMFSCCEFSKDSLLVGTANGKIYCYNIYDYKMIYYIPNAIYLNKSSLSLFLNNEDRKSMNNDIDTQDGPSINKILINESLNMILIQSKDNSMLLATLSDIIKGTRKQFNFISTGLALNSFSYSHYERITSIEFIDESSSDFYSSSTDQSLMLWKKINAKWTNTYFDLEKLNNSMSNNYSNQSINKVYLSVIKFHPIDKTKLYAGDNKGSLYIFDTNNQQIQQFKYKKLCVGTYSISSLFFNTQKHLISISFDSGMNVICDLNNNCEFSLKLSDHIFTPGEIESRVIKGHLVSYSYFFTQLKHKEVFKDDCLILYLKSRDQVQISRLYTGKEDIKILYSRNETILQFPDEILDLVMHTSEEYVIALIKGNKIAVMQIDNGDITGVIDLDSQASYSYSLTLDSSGLFIGVVCNLRSDKELKSSLIIFEVGTGKIRTSVTSLFEISNCRFALNGLEVVICGAKGFVSIWELPAEMKNSIRGVLNEIKRNKAFWDQYEIKYWSGNSNDKVDNVFALNKMEIAKNSNTNLNTNLIAINANKENNVFDEINKETANIQYDIMQSKTENEIKNKDIGIKDAMIQQDFVRIDQNNNDNNKKICNEVNKGNDFNQMITLGQGKFEEEKKNVMPYYNRQEPQQKVLINYPRYVDNEFNLSDYYNQNKKRQQESKTLQNNDKEKPKQSDNPNTFNSLSQRNFDYNKFAIRKENQFEAIPKVTYNQPNNTMPIINKNTNIPKQPIQAQTTKSFPIANKPNKKDTDFVINLNQDPNFFKAKPINTPIINNAVTAKIQYPNLKQKAISTSSEKKQNDIRMQNISEAVNDILLPSKQENKTKQEYEPSIVYKKDNSIPNDLFTDNRKDYFINNCPNKKTRYPEPEDIDDLLTHSNNKYNEGNANTNDDQKHNTNSNKGTKPNATPYQTEDNNISIVNPISVTDDIDYLSDNIRNFEHMHKIE